MMALMRCRCEYPLLRRIEAAQVRPTPSRTIRTPIIAVVGKGNSITENDELVITDASRPLMTAYSTPPLIDFGRRIAVRRNPEIGLLSIIFVLSSVIGAIVPFVVFALPTATAFRRLRISMVKLDRLAAEEVPATLLSLKLSIMEISDLAKQLNNLRYGNGIKERKKQ